MEEEEQEKEEEEVVVKKEVGEEEELGKEEDILSDKEAWEPGIFVLLTFSTLPFNRCGNLSLVQVEYIFDKTLSVTHNKLPSEG